MKGYQRRGTRGWDHAGKYEQSTLQLDDEQAERIPPPRLNQIDPEDLERAKKDGLSRLYRPGPATVKRLESLFKRAWDLFYELLTDENGTPFITAFFVWDSKSSVGNFSLPNDGICCGWVDHAAVGLGETALNSDDAYLQFLIIHELAHAVDTHGPEHSESYEQFLDYMLLAYNEEYGTTLVNDYSGFEGDMEENMIVKNRQRADSRKIPAAWLEKSYRIDGNVAAPIKRKKAAAADDSSQRARQAMIRRMQSEKQTAASENVQIRKDYSGIHR